MAPVGAGAKTQAVPASVRAVLVQVAASAMCVLQSVPPSGSVHVLTEGWSLSPCKKTNKKDGQKVLVLQKEPQEKLTFPP